MIKLETKSYINRVGAKISALSLGIIDKYEYLTGDKLLPPQQHRIIQEAKFSYSPLRKTSEKQTKTIENHGEKQVETLTFFKAKWMTNTSVSATNEIGWRHISIRVAKSHDTKSSKENKKLTEII